MYRAIYLILLGIAFVGMAFFTTTWIYYEQAPELAKIEAAYTKGVKASELADRQTAFNQALSDILELELRYQPLKGNGRLYFQLANTLLQLQAYPLAIYYFYLAQKLRPQDGDIANNLAIALQTQGIEQVVRSSIWDRIFFFHRQLSLPQRLQLFNGLLFAAFVLFSWLIWWPLPGLRILGILTLSLWCIFCISILYTRYVEPLEGVVMHPTFLYKGAGEQFAKVQEMPLMAGTLFSLVSLPSDEHWLKVQTTEGDLGFIKQESSWLLPN